MIGGSSTYFTLSRREPAKLSAWNKPALLFLGTIGGGFGLYGKFVMRYNWLWLGAAIIPLTLGAIINKERQD